MIALEQLLLYLNTGPGAQTVAQAQAAAAAAAAGKQPPPIAAPAPQKQAASLAGGAAALALSTVQKVQKEQKERLGLDLADIFYPSPRYVWRALLPPVTGRLKVVQQKADVKVCAVRRVSAAFGRLSITARRRNWRRTTKVQSCA